MRLFINCGSFATGAWQVCEDKLFHEVLYDQVFAYLGASLLGYTILLNFLTRLIVYSKQECVVVNFLKKRVLPSDRTNLPMQVLRRVYYPLYYHKLMQRMNLLHYSSNSYSSELTKNASLSYPMLTSYEIELDSREDRVIEWQKLESKVRHVRTRW